MIAMRMNKIILLLSWMFLGGVAYVYAGDSSAKEILMQKLESTGHDTLRLKTLCELVDVCKPEPIVRKQYVDELLKEAESQRIIFINVVPTYIIFIYASMRIIGKNFESGLIYWCL